MYLVVKRVFDFSSSLLLFFIISPLFIILAILVRINLGSPVFFHQVRTGKRMKPFGMTKFRTMTNDKDGDGNFLNFSILLKVICLL